MLRRVAKEVDEQETIGGNTRVEGIEWAQDNEDKLLIRAIVYGPIGSLYEGGEWHFEIRIPNDYPFKPPKIKGLTPLYHPQVPSLSDHQPHCFCTCDCTIVGGRWSPSLTITKCLLMF